METELAVLEQKLEQLIRHTAGLSEENRSLRDRVSRLETENRRLADKVAMATHKIESVLALIPEEES